jgi:hypothetical protein
MREANCCRVIGRNHACPAAEIDALRFAISDQSNRHAHTEDNNGLRLSQAGDKTLL